MRATLDTPRMVITSPRSTPAALSTLLAVGLAIVVAASLLSPATAGARAGSVYWGAEIGSQFTGTAAPWDMKAVTAFTRRVAHKPLSLISFNIPFSNCATPRCPYSLPVSALNAVRAYGAIPVLNWSSTGNPVEFSEPQFQLRDIIDGSFDKYLRTFATAVRRWGHPLFLRFDWEMNGFWFPWSETQNGNSAGQFVAMWRHVHNIFKQAGATNASWVWCPDTPPLAGFPSLGELYPGNAYVDWTCLDGYNWGPLLDGPDGWQSFNSLFSGSYAEITHSVAPSKPMMIGEVASSQFGGSKAQWITDMFNELPSAYPKIKAVVWWEVVDRRRRFNRLNLMLENSRASAQAFAHGIANPRFAGNVFAATSHSPIAPP